MNKTRSIRNRDFGAFFLAVWLTVGVMLLAIGCPSHVEGVFSNDGSNSHPDNKLTFVFNGQVTSFNDESGMTDGSIGVGVRLTGRYTIDTTIVDSNELPTVGDYEHTEPGDGIQVEIGSYTFQSHPSDPRFLFEILNDHQGKDGYLLRSYQNQILQEQEEGSLVIVSAGLHISWQLDDDTGTVLPSDFEDAMLLTAPDLDVWTQSFGLTIQTDKGFFIRGTVDEVIQE